MAHTLPVTHAHAGVRPFTTDATRFLAPLGRLLYTAVFLSSVPGHFTRRLIEMAAAEGVPMPGVLVPASGVVLALGALSVLIGYRARAGAWLLVLFLVPVTLTMHAFWKYDDPATAEMQMINFMKNVSMLGAALFIACVGAGPVSVDTRRRRTVSTTPGPLKGGE